MIDEQTAYDVLTDYYHHTTDTQHAALREALGRVETVDAVPVDDVFALAIALNKEIEVLGLSVRAYHALSRWACRTVGDVYVLWKSGKIKKVRNLGDKSIGEIEDRLNAYLRRTDGRKGRWIRRPARSTSSRPARST